MLVYLGAESSMDEEMWGLGFHKQAAPLWGALVVYIEHRYYGQSVPFESAHWDANMLGYLSVSQALADYAVIVLQIKDQLKFRGPVIAIGCSYGGMLSTYFRLKYPHIVHGALSSSAPVNFVNGDVSSRSTYHDIVSQDFKHTSPNCFDTIKRSWAEIDRAYREYGMDFLRSIFNPCSPDATVGDLKQFLLLKYTELAQYDHPHLTPVRKFCEGVNNLPPGAPDILRIRAGLSEVSKDSCLQPAPGPRLFNAWEWQTCTELVMPLGPADGPDSMFEARPFSIETTRRYCQQMYNVQPRIGWMATAYNVTPAALANFGSNIIFSNGKRDPYSGGGVLQSISSSIVALTTEEGSHCLDVADPRPETDPGWLNDMRVQELKLIEAWLISFRQYHS